MKRPVCILSISIYEGRKFSGSWYGGSAGRGAFVPVFTDEIEHSEAIPIAHHSLTVDQAGLHRQQGHCRDDLRKAACEVFTLARQQPHAAINALR